jgi:lipoprotein-releasing system permease protein
MRYEWLIARRYLTARRKQAFISVITVISTLGIGIGVMALVIALALITGFQGDVQDKILGATSHIMVSDLAGEGLRDTGTLEARIRTLPNVVSVTPVVYNTVLVQGPSRSTGGYLKGVDIEREAALSPWLLKLEKGRLPREGGPEGILLGQDMAVAIGAGVGDAVTVLTASSRLSPIGLLPRTKRFQVAGIFKTGLFEFDSTTALLPIAAAQKFLGMGDRISYLQVRVRDIFRAARTGEAIEALSPGAVYVTTWMELNESLFSALKLEKSIMFLTITLIVVVAALNIIASLILMVMEKTRDIGILMALGATPRSIRRVFFFQGAVIGVVGTAAGLVLGLVWCGLANAFRLIKVPVDIYQISYVPFHVKPLDLALIVGVTLAISFSSTLFPARRAARIDPVVALKYE